MLSPIRDDFIFEFCNQTQDGLFIEKSKVGIILTNKDVIDQLSFARWGKVHAVGPQVEDFRVGDYVLIESGKWTMGFTHDDTKLWKSESKYVCATGADESVTYAYK